MLLYCTFLLFCFVLLKLVGCCVLMAFFGLLVLYGGVVFWLLLCFVSVVGFDGLFVRMLRCWVAC